MKLFKNQLCCIIFGINISYIRTHTCIHAASEEMMSKGVKAMEGNLEKLRAELKHHQKPQDKHDKFAAKIQDFLMQAEARFKKLEDQFQFMEKKFEDLAAYYCFDRKKLTMEEFFGDIVMFCKDYDVSLSLILANVCSMRYNYIIIIFFFLFVQRAAKENAKIKEQMERQRIAKEREVCY